MCRQRLRIVSIACVSTAVALAAVPSASAEQVPGPPVAADGEPTKAERRGFNEAKAAINHALTEDDWETLLHEADRALRLLPESAQTHAERAEVMQPVGAYELDARTREQLVRSAAIVALYIRQLDDAHGADARAKEDRDQANKYLAEIQRLLDESAPISATPSTRPLLDSDLPSRTREPDTPGKGRGLIIGGGVSIGIGVVLLVVGITQAVRWNGASDHYEELRARDEGGIHVDSEDEAEAVAEWYRAAGATLGTALPGAALLGVGTGLVVVGTRRNATAKMSLGPGGLEVSF